MAGKKHTKCQRRQHSALTSANASAHTAQRPSWCCHLRHGATWQQQITQLKAGQVYLDSTTAGVRATSSWTSGHSISVEGLLQLWISPRSCNSSAPVSGRERKQPGKQKSPNQQDKSARDPASHTSSGHAGIQGSTRKTFMAQPGEKSLQVYQGLDPSGLRQSLS